MHNQKIAAIVPAFNEEKNIGNVLRILLDSPELDEIVVVDDGSRDGTAAVARQLGASVLPLPQNMGKGRAMRKGVEATDAQVIFFCDADLVGLTPEHVRLLVAPVAQGAAVLSVGIRDRWWGLPYVLARLFPVTMAIGGERAIRADVFKQIPERYLVNLSDTLVINYACAVNALPVRHVLLKGLNIVVKERKWGFARGLVARWKMITELIVMRVRVMVHKKDLTIKI